MASQGTDESAVTGSNPEPRSAGAAEPTDASITDTDLHALIAAWAKLPPDVRQVIARLAGLAGTAD